MKKQITFSLILIPFLVIMFFLALAHYLFKVEYGVGVDSVEWLPTEARNISYFYDHSTFKKAEFEIEQEAFESWCISINKPLKKLGDNETADIIRCLYYLQKKGITIEEPQPEGDSVTDEEYSSLIKRFSPGDLYYEEVWDNGGGYWIGYDISEGKGYYSDASH